MSPESWRFGGSSRVGKQLAEDNENSSIAFDAPLCHLSMPANIV
jgi:hypothetical protein